MECKEEKINVDSRCYRRSEVSPLCAHCQRTFLGNVGYPGQERYYTGYSRGINTYLHSRRWENVDTCRRTDAGNHVKTSFDAVPVQVVEQTQSVWQSQSSQGRLTKVTSRGGKNRRNRSTLKSFVRYTNKNSQQQKRGRGASDNAIKRYATRSF